MLTPLDIFVTGGTGYIGQHLVPVLLARGHRVRVLARQASVDRVPGGATPVVGDALQVDSVAAALRPGDTMIHLVGTPHPTPSKADQFEKVDLLSIRATVSAAKQTGISHLLYLSVAQPAPIMQAYLWVRALGETMIREAGLTATIVRPWYVLGPGRWWPKAIMPLYKIAEMIPATRATAERLGLVTIEQMVNALVYALENPPASGQRRIVDVSGIRRARLSDNS
jgi:nucleoside-diphosphate-sugar epimerase